MLNKIVPPTLLSLSLSFGSSLAEDWEYDAPYPQQQGQLSSDPYGYNEYNDNNKEHKANFHIPYSYEDSSNDRKCGPECNCGCTETGICTCKEYNRRHTYEENPNLGPPPPYLQTTSRDSKRAEECGRKGIWLPEDPMLFRPLIADPREITYSAGWRFDDQVLARNVIDVSFGDSVPFYRWFNMWPWNGQMQIDLEGAIWVVFEPLEDSSPLTNADYYGGLVLSYGVGEWSFRLRAYHISSHIGDEFMIENPHFLRRNASNEYIDFYVSLDWTDEIRLYSGVGYIIAEDDEWRIGRFFGAIGTEVRLHRLGFVDWCTQLYGEPYLGMHFRHNKSFKHHVDATYVLGYEWGRLCGLCRKLRVYMEYHDGYSLEGQFQKEPTNYFSIRASYGF